MAAVVGAAVGAPLLCSLLDERRESSVTGELRKRPGEEGMEGTYTVAHIRTGCMVYYRSMDR